MRRRCCCDDETVNVCAEFGTALNARYAGHAPDASLTITGYDDCDGINATHTGVEQFANTNSEQWGFAMETDCEDQAIVTLFCHAVGLAGHGPGVYIQGSSESTVQVRKYYPFPVNFSALFGSPIVINTDVTPGKGTWTVTLP